uniref:Uncharacterized protein n=2 Tax=Cacopsylla melanoneura TaxID=428564 RepID=A0A8D9DXF9_9HEMI
MRVSYFWDLAFRVSHIFTLSLTLSSIPFFPVPFTFSLSSTFNIFSPLPLDSSSFFLVTAFYLLSFWVFRSFSPISLFLSFVCLLPFLSPIYGSTIYPIPLFSVLFPTIPSFLFLSPFSLFICIYLS